MRILIVEDDFISRKVLQKMLAPYGECDFAVNGLEALEAYKMAISEKKPYHLICLDIMMPGMDGQQVLKCIRQQEMDMCVKPSDEVKIIMTTALDSPRDVVEAYYRGGCTSYLVKPIDKTKLVSLMQEFGLVK